MNDPDDSDFDNVQKAARYTPVQLSGLHLAHAHRLCMYEHVYQDYPIHANAAMLLGHLPVSFYANRNECMKRLLVERIMAMDAPLLALEELMRNVLDFDFAAYLMNYVIGGCNVCALSDSLLSLVIVEQPSFYYALSVACKKALIVAFQDVFEYELAYVLADQQLNRPRTRFLLQLVSTHAHLKSHAVEWLLRATVSKALCTKVCSLFDL